MVRLSLPLLDAGRHRDGPSDWRLRREKRNAAGRDGRTAAAAVTDAGDGPCCTITTVPPGPPEMRPGGNVFERYREREVSAVLPRGIPRIARGACGHTANVGLGS